MAHRIGARNQLAPVPIRQPRPAQCQISVHDLDPLRSRGQVCVPPRRRGQVSVSPFGRCQIAESAIWHAPASKNEPARIQESESKQIAGEVKSCVACGFPVLPGRALCVECELKSDAPVVAARELFSLPNHENWISEHGYTVASLIVSALAAAVILWLKR